LRRSPAGPRSPDGKRSPAGSAVRRLARPKRTCCPLAMSSSSRRVAQGRGVSPRRCSAAFPDRLAQAREPAAVRGR
jgi:hypothetical protein